MSREVARTHVERPDGGQGSTNALRRPASVWVSVPIVGTCWRASWWTLLILNSARVFLFASALSCHGRRSVTRMSLAKSLHHNYDRFQHGSVHIT